MRRSLTHMSHQCLPKLHRTSLSYLCASIIYVQADTMPDQLLPVLVAHKDAADLVDFLCPLQRVRIQATAGLLHQALQNQETQMSHQKPSCEIRKSPQLEIALRYTPSLPRKGCTLRPVRTPHRHWPQIATVVLLMGRPLRMLRRPMTTLGEWMARS